MLHQFRRWLEYDKRSFLASGENALLKMETSSEEIPDVVDSTNVSEEDDLEEKCFEKEGDEGKPVEEK